MTPEELEELQRLANSFGPEAEQARAMLRMLLEGQQQQESGAFQRPQYDPMQMNPQTPFGAPLQMYPAVDKDGNLDLNDQLTQAGKWNSDVMDRSATLGAGPEGYAPGTFDANPTWEELKTPTRDNLRSYASAGDDWRSVVAQSLLGNPETGDPPSSPAAAVRRAQQMIEDGLIPGPIMETGLNANKEPGVAMEEFAVSNFEKLATEPNVDHPDVRANPVTGVYEIKTDEGLSDTHQWFVDNGIPLPTEQYDMDWYRGTDAGGRQLADIEQRIAAAEKDFNAAQIGNRPFGERTSVQDQFGTSFDRANDANQARLEAQAKYYLGQPDTPESMPDRPEGMYTNGRAVENPPGMYTNGRAVENPPGMYTNGGGGEKPPGMYTNGGGGGIVGGLAAAALNLQPGKANRANASRLKAMADEYSKKEQGRTATGGRKAPRREVRYRETKDQRDQQFNSMKAKNAAHAERNMTEGDLNRMRAMGRTPMGDVREAREMAYMRALGLI